MTVTLDLFRKKAKNIIPFSIYKRISRLVDILFLLRNNEFNLLKIFFANKKDGVEQIYIKTIAKTISIRNGTPDYNCIVQNIIREEYSYAKKSDSPELIIDGGGYIGDTALYFRKLFPETPIVVLEPELQNFELCKKNLETSNFIDLRLAGLSNKNGSLKVSNNYWSAKSEYLENMKESVGLVDAITIDQILQDYPKSKVSILKMDIEGAETNILNDRNSRWPENTEMILVETHGTESEKSVNDFAYEYNFEIKKFRSITILLSKK